MPHPTPTHFRLALAGLTLAATLGAAPCVQAATFSADYVFGDSLSDNGNLAEALGHNFPNPPHFHDSFTNGPTAVALFAQRLGLTSDPSLWTSGFVDRSLGLTPGTNYAVAGATSSTLDGVAINLPQQVGAFLAHSGGRAPGDALYTVLIGGTDVRNAAHLGNPAIAAAGEAAEAAQIQTLISAGARHILVVNVPDVGRIPEFALFDPSQAAAAHADTIGYNARLAADIASLGAANPGTLISSFDLFAFSNNLIAHAGLLGITDTTAPCYLNTAAGVTQPPAPVETSASCGPIDPATNQAANIGQLYFFDEIHPTEKVQAAFADALFATEIPTSVPEPASLALLSAGIVGLAALRRRAARHLPGPA